MPADNRDDTLTVGGLAEVAILANIMMDSTKSKRLSSYQEGLTHTANPQSAHSAFDVPSHTAQTLLPPLSVLVYGGNRNGGRGLT